MGFMLSAFWNLILVSPILNLLLVIYRITGSLGWSIVALTVIVRTLLIPTVIPSLRAIKKQQDIQPELNKLKEKFKYDQRKLASEQMLLFKKHGINPASGCLTQIVMIIVLIALFSVIQLFTINGDHTAINSKIYFEGLKLLPDEKISTTFGYLDLAKPDPLYVLALLSGLLQFVASKMMAPLIRKAEKVAEKTEPKSDDIAFQMQQQSLYIMPLMNVVIGVTLPSGVLLYIVVTTVFSIAQQYFLNGWGGMASFFASTARKKEG